MSNAKAIPAPKAKAEKPAKKQSDLRRVLRMLNRFLVGNRSTFVLAMIMLALNSSIDNLAAYPLPWFVEYLTDRVAPLPFQQIGLTALFATPLTALTFVAVVIIVLALFSSITDSLSEIFLSKGGRTLGYNLRAALFGHLQKLSLAFFGKQRTGDLLTRVTSDVTALEVFAIDSLKDIAGSVFTLISALIFLTLGSPLVAVIALIMVPVLSIVSNFFADRIKSLSKKVRAREGELAANTQEMLTSIRVIQTYGSGGNQLKQFADISRQTMETALKAARLQAWFSGVFGVLQAVTIVLVAVAFTWLMDSQGFKPSQLLAYATIITNTFKPTKRLIKQWNEVGKILASVERIGDVLDRKPAVEDSPSALPAPRFEGHVAFNHISFAYMPEPEDIKEGQALQPRLALRDVSFTIEPGEVVALVGGSGAGKSTIVQLLPRLYDPHAGSITIDGADIRSFGLDSLRSRMSMVLQEAILFTGTVAENIAYGRDNATREEVIAAAIQASAHEFIEQLPDGYETVLSERASNLSGGQRQRIAIARAFIRNTPVLILDEPTTGLDAESTDLVLLALRSLMRGKATLIISHDLNLIRQANKIIVIKQGEIQQVGTHKDLLREGGLYADLYNKQFGKAVEEQGAKIKPSAPLVPAVLDDDDDEEALAAPPRAFQTLIGHALPAPATPKAFQTLMMQGAVPPPPSQPAPAPANAPVASPPVAKQVAPPPVAKQVAPLAAKQVTPPPAKPAQTPAARPAPVPAIRPTTPAPAPAVKPAAPEQEDKPKPSIFATTVMRTIPEPPAPPATGDAPAAATGATQLYPAQKPADPAPAGRSGTRSTDADIRTRRAAIQAQRDMPVSAGQAGRSGLRGEKLDILNSPVIQGELPGLRAAFDTAAMREQIQAVLFGKARPSYTVEQCEVDQATYMPGEGCAIRYEVLVRDRTTQKTFAPLVVGLVFPTQLAAALYMRDRLAPLAELMRGRPEIAPFAAPAALIEPLNMALYVFPIDGEMPALVGASDPERMREVLSETLPQALDNTFTVEKCEVELVDYARRYRAVLRYHLEGKRSSGGRVEQQTVYGKVFTSNIGALAGPVTAALRERLIGVRSGDYHFGVPRSLGWRPDMQLSLLEALPGKPLISDLLKARLRGRTTEPEIMSLREMIDACAKIAATLHTSDIKLGRRRTLDDEIASLRTGFADVQRISPELGVLLESWLSRISTYAEQSDALNLSFAHGDYTYTQLIFAGQQAGLVDFDSVCQAEPALDVGHFLAYLRVAGFKAQKLADDRPTTLVEELCERFLNTYITTMGERVDDEERLRVRVAIYQIISLLRRALRSWQKFKGSRLENALALIEEEMACLPQLDY
jgi:ABC-type multidrug transport system fused ATPase/permease subunit/thiamine kinase-like enzyme